MNNEIKEILEALKDNIPIEEYRSEGTSDGLTHYEEDKDSWQYKLLDYIFNLQEENERFKKISHKMHLWIFLHCGDEQKVYDELGLTDEENAMLGYSGQFRMRSEKMIRFDTKKDIEHYDNLYNQIYEKDKEIERLNFLCLQSHRLQDYSSSCF